MRSYTNIYNLLTDEYLNNHHYRYFCRYIYNRLNDVKTKKMLQIRRTNMLYGYKLCEYVNIWDKDISFSLIT